jgi:hypothetical protein
MQLDDLLPNTGTSLKKLGLENYQELAADETQPKWWQVTTRRHHALPINTPVRSRKIGIVPLVFFFKMAKARISRSERPSKLRIVKFGARDGPQDTKLDDACTRNTARQRSNNCSHGIKQ